MEFNAKFIIGFICLVLVFPLSLKSQSVISGEIVDLNHEPLIGATVWLKQGQVGTAADEYGRFELSAAANDTLLVSYLGYSNMEVPVAGQETFLIILTPEIELLEQVVVLGYGSQRKKDITGATSSVIAEDFNNGVVNSPEQLIQGKVAGVELLQNDGEPGAAFTVRIRGTSTIRANNEPLYVIDGYPIDISDPGPIIGGPARGTRKNPLEFLNPEDIASIDILKDASAAAIYGARGANGVVLITTKKGRIGRPQFSYSTYMGLSQLRKKVDVLSPDAYRTALNDFGLGINDFNGRTDWQDEVYQTATVQNHNLSLNGGGQNTRYRASFNFLDQEGIIRNSEYTKYNGRFRLQQSAIKDRLQIDFNLSSSIVRDQRAPREVVIGTLSQNPTWPVLDNEGNFFQPIESSEFVHPIAFLELSSNVINTTRLLSNLSVSFDVVKGLEYKINLGGNFSNATGKSFEYPQISNRNGRASISNRTLSSNLIEHYLTYNKQFGTLKFTGLGGYSFQEFRNEGSFFARGDFPFDNLPLVNNISAGREPLGEQSWKEKNALQSFFGRVHFGLQSKYLVTANFRADGSTRFGANNKYGYFPSVAVAWRISEEGFLQGLNFLDDLKIRASWGLTGNQEIPNKISQPLFGTPQSGQAIFGPSGQPTIGYAYIRTANPQLKWEETRQIDLGVDISLNQGRWNLSVDYFDKSTTDFLLFTQAASAPTSSIWTNLDGTILNRGWEFAFNGHLLRNGPLKWETGLTFTKVNNTVEGLPTPINVGSVIGRGQSGVGPQIIMNNAPLGVFYGRRWLGFDENGNDQFKKDAEGNDLFEELGYALPDFTWGWSNNFQLRNFGLNILFTGAQGHEVLNNGFLTGISKQNFPFGTNSTRDLLYSDESINNNLTYSSRHIEDGSFIRLSQVTLSYQFPVGGSSWLSQLQVYVTGSNLLLWTDYQGYDPEVNIPINNDNAIPSIGVDWDAIPRPLSVQFGLKASFL